MHLFDKHWIKASVPVFALLLGARAFAADRHKPDVDAESADGILLQRIQQEPRPPRKLALLEKYVAEYSKTTSIAWVYEQLLPIYSAAKDYDKVIATADAMLAVDPADVDAAHDGLTAAQAKNDNEAIRLYAQRSWDAATKSLQTPKPSDPDDVLDWNKQQEFARQVLTFSEYVLSTEAAAETDDTKRTELIRALQSRNPQSKFLAAAKKDGGRIDLASLSPERAVALAEKGLLLDPNNEDFLITVADYNMGREKDLPKVLTYSLRILELMPKKSKPDDIAPQAWEAKKTKYIGWANWMAGIIYGKQGRYGLSDRYLRSALAYVQEDPRLLAAAYFYLGYANYAIAGELRDKGHAIEAAKFSKMCASIDGPFQSLAQRTLETIRNEYNVR